MDTDPRGRALTLTTVAQHLSTTAEAPESNNDEANAFAAAQPRAAHFALQQRWRRPGLSFSQSAKEVMSLRRPPALHFANEHPPVWPSRPLSRVQGMCVLCGRVLPAMPHLHADSHLCGACRLRGTDTKVVSTASCTPPNQGNPSAITLILLPSKWFSTPKSRSLTRTLVLTRPPANAGRYALNCETSTLLSWHMRTGGGQERQRDGHGTRVQTDEVEAGGDATGELENSGVEPCLAAGGDADKRLC